MMSHLHLDGAVFSIGRCFICNQPLLYLQSAAGECYYYHMNSKSLYPRYLYPRVLEALADSPAVLIHGARQCGKTTLAQVIGSENGYAYYTFDDDIQLEAATADPIGYVRSLPEKVILDEIQRVPRIFTSLKSAIDSGGKPGQFILTGSANVLLIPQLADSLAGRMEILCLHPLAQCEIHRSQSSFLDDIFNANFQAHRKSRSLGSELIDMVTAGGFPAVLKRTTERRRATWQRNYITTLIQRDIRDLGRINHLDVVPRLLEAIAGETATLLNVSNLSAPFQVSRPTIREYINLLNLMFLVEELPAWHRNHLKRFVKSPKIHFTDTGLVAAILGVGGDSLIADRTLYGRMVETFILQELKRQASWWDREVSFSHYRDKDKVEVDIVLQSGNKLAGIEVKAGATVTRDDFKGLARLRTIDPAAFVAGVVVYDGDAIVPFGEKLFAVPIAELTGINAEADGNSL